MRRPIGNQIRPVDFVIYISFDIQYIFSTIYNKDGKFINHEILNHEYDWEQDSDRRCSITLLNFNEIEYIKIHEDECGLYNTDIVIECFTIE